MGACQWCSHGAMDSSMDTCTEASPLHINSLATSFAKRANTA